MGAKERNRMKELKKAGSRLRQQEYAQYCECSHTDENGYSIFSTGRYTPNGERIFQCRDCGHDVIIGRLDMGDLEGACQRLLNACDIIKMHLSPDDDRLKKLCIMMQANIPNLIKAYSAVVKRVEQKKDAGERRRTGGTKANTIYGGAETSVYNRTVGPRRR